MDTEITKPTIELRKFLRSRVFTSHGIFQETWVGKILEDYFPILYIQEDGNLVYLTDKAPVSKMIFNLKNTLTEEALSQHKNIIVTARERLNSINITNSDKKLLLEELAYHILCFNEMAKASTGLSLNKIKWVTVPLYPFGIPRGILVCPLTPKLKFNLDKLVSEITYMLEESLWDVFTRNVSELVKITDFQSAIEKSLNILFPTISSGKFNKKN